MAVGVPEADVFAAADRVLERGERPTVERVRVELGRGSPARVGQLLEVWWDALAKRLAGETRLPALPTAASAAFTDLWRVAIDEARTVAHHEFEQQRVTLEAERVQFQTDRAHWEQRVVEANQARNDAEAARSQAAERLEDMQRLATQLESQAAEATERQKALEIQLQAVERDRRALQEHLTAREAAAALEREAAAQHLRAVEDRGHTEVDRARHEAKVLRTELERVDRAHQQAVREAQHREAELRLRLGQEERSNSQHAARVGALEEQLARLDGLGDALRRAQEAMQDGLGREAHLRQALEEEVRRKTSDIKPGAKSLGKKASAKAKRP